MSLTIEDRERQLVEAILAHHLPGLEVWAFGSRVRGHSREHSDLDLALVSSEPMPLKLRGAIEEAFRESLLPFKVDLVDLVCASPTFRQLVEREHIVIQASGPGQLRPPFP